MDSLADQKAFLAKVDFLEVLTIEISTKVDALLLHSIITVGYSDDEYQGEEKNKKRIRKEERRGRGLRG